MRKSAVCLLVIGLTQASAFGGLVTFSPEKATYDYTVEGSSQIKFDVFLSDLPESNNLVAGFDIIFGAGLVGTDSNGLELVDFTFDAAFLGAPIPATVLTDQRSDLYLDDIKIGVTRAFATPSFFDTATPLRLGSLVVDAAGLIGKDGKYEVIVDFGLDGASFTTGPASDPANSFLTGAASVNVVPEPATISLLGLASLALIRRRRKA